MTIDSQLARKHREILEEDLLSNFTHTGSSLFDGSQYFIRCIFAQSLKKIQGTLVKTFQGTCCLSDLEKNPRGSTQQLNVFVPIQPFFGLFFRTKNVNNVE